MTAALDDCPEAAADNIHPDVRVVTDRYTALTVVRCLVYNLVVDSRCRRPS